MFVNRFFIKLLLAVGAVVGFVFYVVLGGLEYLGSRWQLFFETCAGITRSVFDYFLYTDHIGIMLALSFVLFGVFYAVIIAVVEIVKTHIVRRRLLGLIKYDFVKGVYIIEEAGLHAFTIGFFSPAVFISEELVDLLSTKALAAVVAHERLHKDAYHPLIKFLFRIFRALFFYIPGLSAVGRYLHVNQELLADKVAIEKTSRVSLAEAFLVLYGQPVRSKLAAVSGFTSLRERIDYLVSDTKPSVFSFFQSKTVFFSILVFCMFFGFLTFVPRNYSLAVTVDSDLNVCEGVQQSMIQSILK